MPRTNEHGIGKTREKAYRWSGGRHVAWNGYVRVLLRDHPRALSNGYVWEHIVVAEQKIGRSLVYFGKSDPRNESVHHINGNKTDNRPENLAVLHCSKHSKLEWEENSHIFPQSKLTKERDPSRFEQWRISNCKTKKENLCSG